MKSKTKSRQATAAYAQHGLRGTLSMRMSSSFSTVMLCNISFANTSNAPITVSLTINRPPSTVAFIVKQSTVPVGGTLVAIGSEQKVILQANDTLQGSASVANACDTLVSVLEIT